MEKTPVTKSDQKVILVVDDDPQILALVSAILVDGNYSVLIWSDLSGYG